MRRILFIAALLFAVPLLAPSAQAQTATHKVTLTWTDALNPAGSTTYTVYRATGLCSGTPTFSKLATGVATLTFADSTVTPGNYCFAVSATVAGVESALSVSALATVPAFMPTALQVTVQ
jgi:uncharacterized protein (DUF2141 family)